MDENNQYGQEMTKPLPNGCIKKQNVPSILEFNKILDRVSHEDNIGHLFIVDIKFHNINERLSFSMKFTHLYLKKIKEWSLLKDQLYS